MSAPRLSSWSGTGRVCALSSPQRFVPGPRRCRVGVNTQLEPIAAPDLASLLAQGGRVLRCTMGPRSAGAGRSRPLLAAYRVPLLALEDSEAGLRPMSATGEVAAILAPLFPPGRGGAALRRWRAPCRACLPGHSRARFRPACCRGRFWASAPVSDENCRLWSRVGRTAPFWAPALPRIAVSSPSPAARRDRPGAAGTDAASAACRRSGA